MKMMKKRCLIFLPMVEAYKRKTLEFAKTEVLELTLNCVVADNSSDKMKTISKWMKTECETLTPSNK